MDSLCKHLYCWQYTLQCMSTHAHEMPALPAPSTVGSMTLSAACNLKVALSSAGSEVPYDLMSEVLRTMADLKLH